MFSQQPIVSPVLDESCCLNRPPVSVLMQVGRQAVVALDELVQHVPCCMRCVEVLLSKMPSAEGCSQEDGPTLCAAFK